jgi:hypothetical protein
MMDVAKQLIIVHGVEHQCLINDIHTMLMNVAKK